MRALRRDLPRPRGLLGLLGLPFASAVFGCAASLPPGATALDRVTVEGNEEIPTDDVVSAMASDPTHKLLGVVHVWWVDYGIYDRITLDKDLQRIERYYRAHGFYEAHVRAGRVVPTGDHEVRVEIVLEEGPKVVVARVDETGIAALPADVVDSLHSAVALRPGDVFDEKRYHESAVVLQRTLTDAGYAYAVVKLSADVDLTKHEATLHVDVTSGPRCTFGDVSIAGLAEVPEDAVRTIVDVSVGHEYSTNVLRGAQRALFELGVFDTVEVAPDLSHPGAEVVPVTIKVTESKLRRVKIGGGLLFDPLRDDVHVLGAWEDHNFLGGLRSLHAELRPLLVLKPGLTKIHAVRPGFTSSVILRQPSFLEPRTTGSIGGTTGIIPDPINDYRLFTTRASVGLERRFGAHVGLGLFYRKGFDFPTPYGDASLPANVFTAQIGYLEWLASLDLRDSVLSPHSGFYASISAQYAFASKFVLGGDFGDVRLQPEARAYLPLGKVATLAFRVMTGLLFARNYQPHFPNPRAPTADDPSAYERDTAGDTPLWRAFFSGGASSNRGYPTRYIGLRDCAEGEVGRDCSQVIGGATLWEASIELRFEIIGDLSGALFLDGSDVSRNPLDVRLNYPHLSAGPGLRYQTPFGPVRIDFGWRLPGLQRIGGQLDPREEPQEFRFLVKGPFALHLSIGEAF